MASDNDKTKLVVNQPYDETLSIYDDEEIVSTITPSPRAPSNPKGKGRKSDPMAESLMVSDDDDFDHDDTGDFQIGKPPVKPNPSQEDVKMEQAKQPSRPSEGPRPPGGHVIEASDDDDEDDDDEDDQSDSSDEGIKGEGNPEGTYDPADYEHLPVNQEIKELFQYITRYTPQTIDLD